MNLQQVDNLSMQAQLNELTKQFQLRQLLEQLLFQQILKHCSRTYPDSEPPTCIEWEKPFFNGGGGTDPLKYIYIYRNEGKPELNIPRHWHYIGLGLSDIHGYKSFCHLHEHFRSLYEWYAKNTKPLPEHYPAPQNLELNGFGFELTFRLKCNSDEEWIQPPPSWPRKIMQDLARYVFQTRNTFSVGDHAAWHGPLDSDGDDQESSRIKHLLMTLDPQLGSFVPDNECKTMGPVTFIQMIGVCDEELQAAREWNVGAILDIMREREETGGQFLVTDMRRGETIFESEYNNSDRVEQGICSTGSNLVQVTVKHKISYIKPAWYIEVERQTPSETYKEEIEFYNENIMSSEEAQLDYPARTPSRMSQGSESALKIENLFLSNPEYPRSIYILLSEESARVLPIMLNGRFAHRRTFHFQSFRGDSLITFQPEGSHLESMVNSEKPFAKQGIWLQIYVSNELRELMWNSIKEDFSGLKRTQSLDNENDFNLPKNYSWPKFNLYLTVVKEF